MVHQEKALIEQLFNNLPYKIQWPTQSMRYTFIVQWEGSSIQQILWFCLAVFSKVGMKRDTAFYFQQLSTLMHLPNFLIVFPLFSEPIVEIKARINISIASWYKGTPIPMVCIAEQSDFEKEQLHVS